MDHPTLLRLGIGAARIALALVLGAVLGLNRTASGKSVGPRTMGLVAMGAALMTWTGSLYALQGHDPSAGTRVLQGLITGIGFLGGGVILHDKQQHVRGLTTAATIWFVAAMGGVIGLGEYAIACVGAMFAVAVLLSRPLEVRVRRWLRGRKQEPRPPRQPIEAS